jgi:phosphatidylglycerol:prolipoprotein diacylglycerol transferase
MSGRRHGRTGRGRGQTRQPAVPLAGAAAKATPAELEALVVTRSFDSGDGSEPYAATVRFTGRRAGVQGKPSAADTFTHDEQVAVVLPGTGPVSITASIYDVRPGEWSVDAALIAEPPPGRPGLARTRVSRTTRPVKWAWRRWALEPALATVKTRWSLLAPLAASPAVLPGSYPVLAAIGLVLALWLQTVIVAAEGPPAGSTLVVSALAVVAGLIGAKLWYIVLHPDEPLLRAGWAVDGFLVVAPLVALAGLAASDLPIGAVLDAAAPGLFFAVAIGRIGCFLAGCCAGEPRSHAGGSGRPTVGSACDAFRRNCWNRWPVRASAS